MPRQNLGCPCDQVADAALNPPFSSLLDFRLHVLLSDSFRPAITHSDLAPHPTWIGMAHVLDRLHHLHGFRLLRIDGKVPQRGNLNVFVAELAKRNIAADLHHGPPILLDNCDNQIAATCRHYLNNDLSAETHSPGSSLKLRNESQQNTLHTRWV